MIRPALIAAALLAATPAIAQERSAQRYQLDLSVVQNGVEVVSTRTWILEDAPASASASVGGTTYAFEADLFAVQGDGDDAQMQLEARLSRNDARIAAPRLTFLRGDKAAVRVGDGSGDLLSMTITPIE
ncbi:hypothetical protein [Brevundimonas sp.]|uniref:hypothetical protein n=1 Tax=Brevundimonas sp. TaxID=1871086 RepID=UPI002737A097|nr:hypothetical protein [Brevundimonas sp.]MDP3801731.1 hypothetical protein [Brevundimonas sp.]